MNVDGKTVNLAPSMAATVEIKTVKRKPIEFLVSPLMRRRQGGRGEMMDVCRKSRIFLWVKANSSHCFFWLL